MSGRGRPATNVEGRRFFRLLAQELVLSGLAGVHAQHWCLCRCGVEVLVPTYRLLRGETKSCGCWRREHTGLFRKRVRT